MYIVFFQKIIYYHYKFYNVTKNNVCTMVLEHLIDKYLGHHMKHVTLSGHAINLTDVARYPQVWPHQVPGDACISCMVFVCVLTWKIIYTYCLHSNKYYLDNKKYIDLWVYI